MKKILASLGVLSMFALPMAAMAAPTFDGQPISCHASGPNVVCTSSYNMYCVAGNATQYANTMAGVDPQLQANISDTDLSDSTCTFLSEDITGYDLEYFQGITADEHYSPIVHYVWTASTADANAVATTAAINGKLTDTAKAVIVANIVKIGAVIAFLLGIAYTVRLVRRHAK